MLDARQLTPEKVRPLKRVEYDRLVDLGLFEGERVLVIEIAVSSLQKDREIKARLYAQSRFEEYWLVNVPARQVETFSAPRRGVYTKTGRVERTGTLRPLRFPDVAIRVADLFG